MSLKNKLKKKKDKKTKQNNRNPMLLPGLGRGVDSGVFKCFNFSPLNVSKQEWLTALLFKVFAISYCAL